MHHVLWRDRTGKVGVRNNLLDGAATVVVPHRLPAVIEDEEPGWRAS